jgi:hypothetical protein
MKQTKQDSCEPYYYIGLVVRGTEKQYAQLLKYLGSRNGAQVIYQCKSLTYLHVTRTDPTPSMTSTPKIVIDLNDEQDEGDQ